MLELKRILCNRKSLLLFGILILLHGVFFVLQCNDTKAITLTGEELEAYVEGYEEYIKSIPERIEAMQETSLYQDQDSFVYRNLLKTGEDYKKLVGIKPKVGENRGILTLMNFNLSNFILVLIGLYIVLCFLEERQNGLYLLVRSTERGRVFLSLQRIGILIFGLFAAAFLLFCSSFLISSIVFGGSDLTRPVQSVPEFESVLGHYSILQYLLLFLVKKVLGCMAICLLLYFCMSMFRSSFCIIAFGLLFLVEYALYSLILPTGKWCVVKFLNVYTYIFCGTQYARYYNLNLFGRPVNMALSADTAIIFSTVVLAGLCLWRYSVQYPKSSYLTIRLVEKLKVWFSRHKPLHTLFGWEAKKVLFSQKGLIIFVLLFYLAYSASTEANYLDARSKYVAHWYKEFAGNIDEERMEEILKKQTEQEWKLERLEKNLEVQKETLEERRQKGWYTAVIESIITDLEKRISEQKKEILGLSVVIKQAEFGLEFKQKTGVTVELFDTSVYELLLHNDKKTILRNYLYILLTVVLTMSGIMACEKSSHMEKVLHSAYKGRLRVLLCKIVLMLGISALCTVSIHAIQYLQIEKSFEFTNKSAIIQSIPCTRNFPVRITIQQYLAFLFSFRVFISVLIGGAVMFISSKFSRITTIAFGVFLLILPMTLVALRF